MRTALLMQSMPPINEQPTPPADQPAPVSGDRLGLVRMVRRLIVFVLGFSVLLVGVVMIVAPGPAFVVIPLGLAILATEFVWARVILESLKKRLLRPKESGEAGEAGPP